MREQLSALADGHLQREEFARVIDAIGAGTELRETWQTYHLVGDVLRSGGHASCSDPALFLSRFQARLAAEPALVRPAPVATLPAVAAAQRAEAANEPVFRWKLVAGAASLAAAAAIGWNWIGVSPELRAPGQQLALEQAAPAAVVASHSAPAPAAALAQANVPAQAVATLAPTRVYIGNGSAQVMLRDPRLDQLLEAHQQAGGASQMPSGFLRNATFDRPSR